MYAVRVLSVLIVLYLIQSLDGEIKRFSWKLWGWITFCIQIKYGENRYCDTLFLTITKQ